MTPKEWGKTVGPRLVRICAKCLTDLVPGEALQNTLAGIGDFHDGDTVVTVSATGPAQLVRVWKCPACGWSVTR